MKSREDVERYMRSCRTKFWQGIFRAELDYRLAHLAGNQDVLSVGCGPAIIESALTEHGFRVTGLDVSQEALDRAPDRVRAVVARAEDMPFAESSFDAVIYVASLQLIEDYRKAIEKTAHVLRPDGRLIVMLLNPMPPFFQRTVQRPEFLRPQDQACQDPRDRKRDCGDVPYSYGILHGGEGRERFREPRCRRSGFVHHQRDTEAHEGR